MARKNTSMIRIDTNSKRELERLNRKMNNTIKLNYKSNDRLPLTTMSKAISDPKVMKMIEKVSMKKFLTNKKGQLQEVGTFLVTLFLVGVFMTIMYKVGSVLQTNLGASSLNDSVESANAIASISKTAMAGDVVVSLIMMGLILLLIISAVLVPTNIIFTVIYLIGGTLFWILSVPLSNAYTQMVSNPSLSDVPANMPITYTLFSKLPLLTTVVLVILLVILYGKRFIFAENSL